MSIRNEIDNAIKRFYEKSSQPPTHLYLSPQNWSTFVEEAHWEIPHHMGGKMTYKGLQVSTNNFVDILVARIEKSAIGLGIGLSDDAEKQIIDAHQKGIKLGRETEKLYSEFLQNAIIEALDSWGSGITNQEVREKLKNALDTYYRETGNDFRRVMGFFEEENHITISTLDLKETIKELERDISYLCGYIQGAYQKSGWVMDDIAEAIITRAYERNYGPKDQ